MKLLSLILAFSMLCWSPAFAGVEFSGCELGVQGVDSGIVTLWGSAGNIGTSQYAICNKITKDGRTALATGVLKNGYVYCYDAIFATSWFLVVYDSSYNLVAVSDTSTTFASGGWIIFTFSGENQVTLTSGQTYYVSPWAKSAVTVGSFGNLKDYANGPTYPTVPDPVTFNDGSLYDSATYLTGTSL